MLLYIDAVSRAGSEESKFRQSNVTAGQVKRILTNCDQFQLYESNPRMIPTRFTPKPAFQALDNHSPFHDSQVGGHKRKPVAQSKATKTVENARGRRKKVRRSIISISQENYLDNNYMLTQPVHYCGASASRGPREQENSSTNRGTMELENSSASHGTMEQENTTAASPIDLVDLSDGDNGNDDHCCSGFRTASSILSRQSDSDKSETEPDPHLQQSQHQQQSDGVELMTSVSRPRDTMTTSTSAQSRSTSDLHHHTTTSTTTAARKSARKSIARTRTNRRHKDLPSVRFGAMLKKAAEEHRDIQGAVSMTHHISHSAKSSLLVCACDNVFFRICNACFAVVLL